MKEERRSDKTLLKLDTSAFRSAIMALKVSDPERAQRLSIERRRLRQRGYEAADPENAKAMKRTYWHKRATPEYLAEKARRERERYAARKEEA